MTIFTRRPSPTMATRHSQGRVGSSSQAHVKRSFDKETTPTPLDDDLFADINWPDDDEQCVSDDESPNCAVSDDGIGEDDESPDAPNGQAEKNKKDDQGISSGNPSTSGTSTSPSDRSGRDSSTSPQDSQGNGRFPKEVRSILRTWYHEHRDNPYPTSEEKDELVAKTGLKRSQISLWLANARRKTRSKKRQDPKAKAELSIFEQSFDDLKPMDRWKVLPIENEVVSGPLYTTIDATYRQRRTFFERQLHPFSERLGQPANFFDCDQSTTVASYFDDVWQQSMASFETGGTYETGPSLVNSGTSISEGTFSSFPSLNASLNNTQASRDRRRRRCHVTRAPKPTAKERSFQCTFCPHTFSTKHDWQRHEKSQHLSLEKWTCCLSGGTFETETGPVCAFCDHANPDTQHLETHNFSACQVKDLDERTFYRKDHFQQHLRLTHEAKFNTRMSAWRSEVTDVKSRCGFCNATFNTWSARADHVAAHFKCRAQMQDWVGDWGFEPHVAALVERAGGIPATSVSQASAMMPPPLPVMKFVVPQPAFSDLAGGGGGGGGGLGKSLPASSQAQQAFQIDPALLPYSTTSFADADAGLLALSDGNGGSLMTDFNGIDVLDWASLGT